jgi:predicted TIM-barrel fold metal-dependent hydrolase
MDRAGVERAVVVCAAIGDNPRNVDDAFEAATRHAGRLVVFPDIGCFWHNDRHAPGAPHRLERATARWDFAGFTHYLAEADDGDWLVGDEGTAFFGLAAARELIVSLFALPHQMPAVVRLARRFPRMPILLHHYGYLGPRSAGTANALQLVLEGAACPNLFVKFSGVGNVVGPNDAYPFEGMRPIVHALVNAFGSSRLAWGSDWPVSSRWMAYEETLSLLLDGSLGRGEIADIAGLTMAKLLGPRSLRAA